MADIVADVGLGFFSGPGGISDRERLGIAIQRSRIRYLKAFQHIMAESAINGSMGKEWFDSIYSDPQRSQKAYSDYLKMKNRSQ